MKKNISLSHLEAIDKRKQISSWFMGLTEVRSVFSEISFVSPMINLFPA